MNDYTTLVLNSKEEVDFYLSKYAVSSVDDLAYFLYKNHHIQVIDKTNESEYTQDNAQNSSEFADEGFSVEELDEIMRNKAIYRN